MENNTSCRKILQQLELRKSFDYTTIYFISSGYFFFKVTIGTHLLGGKPGLFYLILACYNSTKWHSTMIVLS